MWKQLNGRNEEGGKREKKWRVTEIKNGERKKETKNSNRREKKSG